ncbi:hypothetical protein HYX04_03570 [Candidatus Woesearchaeota archaeon]|nr:hypothetical protein [Candidatus Woesearchaeota archaeon]
MIKLKKRLVFVLFIALLILISGCKGKKSTEKSLEEIRTGTEGIVMSFLQNAPPATIHVEKGVDEPLNSFEVILELRNKGAFPQPGEGGTAPVGRMFLSGYDQNILSFDKNSVEEFTGKALEGKSSINPNGGLDLFTFRGQVNVDNLNVEKYEPTLLATACYKYLTVAGPSVCIDPDPYSTIQKKICEAQDISLSSQGAPIAVTKIDEEAFATKTQFKITIKNVGNGDVVKYEAINKCGPSGDKILREDVDKVYLQEVRIGNKVLNCGPFVNTGDSSVRRKAGDIRLINGEGFIICELPSSDYSQSKTAYTTPITITLLYGYRSSIEKKIEIKQETSGITGGSSPPSTERVVDYTTEAY